MVSVAPPLIADFEEMKHKIQAYLNVYDGEVKPHDHKMEGDFEAIFHDEFNDKRQMRERVQILLSTGLEALLIFYKPLDDCTFEAKLLIANHFACLPFHLKGTIQDGKIIKLESYEDAKTANNNWQKIVELSELKQNFEYFIELQNHKGKGVSLNDIGDAFDRLFYDNLLAAINQVQLYQRGMRTASGVPDDFSRARFSLEKCEIIDINHIEVKLNRKCKFTCELWHDVLEVKDGTIVKMEPYTNYNKVTNHPLDRLPVSAW